MQAEGDGDNGYGEFIKTVDTVIMGSKTFEHIHDLAEEFPYPDKKCYVFSRSGTIKKLKYINYAEEINENVPAFLEKLKEREGSKIWIVGGSELLHHFLQEMAIDEFAITFVPVILGSGIPLFKGMEPELKLKLISTRRFGQLVELYYEKILDAN